MVRYFSRWRGLLEDRQDGEKLDMAGINRHLFCVHFALCLAKCLAVPVIFAVLSCSRAWAVDWAFSPSATLSEEYNSNVRFTNTSLPDQTKSDFISKFTPVISITGDTELSQFRFDTTTSALAYINNPKYDTIDTDTKTSLTHAWTSKFSTEGDFEFVHDYTLEDQLQQSGIRTLLTERFQYNFGLTGKYALSESLSLAVGGTAGRGDYPSGLLPNQTTYGVSVTPVWNLSPRDNLSLSSSFDYADYQGTSTIKNFSEMFSWERQVSETLSFKVGGGYQFTAVDYLKIVFVPLLQSEGIQFGTFNTATGTASSNNPVGVAELKKDWTERFSTSISVTSKYYNDANGRSFDMTSFTGSAKYGISERTRLNFDAGYNINQQTSLGNETIDYYRLTPSIERDLSEFLTLRLAGSYEYEIEKGFGGTSGASATINRYRTWAELTYKWPRFVASH